MNWRKPLRVEEVRAVVEKQIDRLRVLRRRDELERRVDENYGIQGIVGRSEAMRKELTLVRQFDRAKKEVVKQLAAIPSTMEPTSLSLSTTLFQAAE